MPDAPNRTDYNAAFQKALDILNPAQRVAVDQIDGPVMVLAGPGTGKTHLLSARIGNILLNTDARSNNILCLTYTDAGVRAMRERLLEMIGPEAHRVNIYTFHGFCSLVIQDNLEYFGRPRLEPLAELERVRLIRKMLDELDVHHPLRLGKGDGYFYERHLYWLFNTMKNEHWSVESTKTAITTYLDSLELDPEFIYQRNGKGYKKGEPKTGQIDQVKRRMDTLRAATELFPEYQRRLNEIGRYDFSDMIQWVLSAFEKYPMLLRSYQERFQYLLVDEFQDTNGAQNELVRQLADFWDSPNIFIVGDDDQAIYEFQGARLRTMLDFHERYADPVMVTLTENYRSSQEILNAAGTLIQANDLRIGRQLENIEIDKQLSAANQAYAKQSGGIQLLEYPDRDQENAAVLQQIKDWHAAGVPYAEMAIIYAAHAQADSLQLLLEASGIPYRSKRPTNVLDEVAVRQLRNLLTYFQKELAQPLSGEHQLYQLLHYRCFGLKPLDLAKVSLRKAGEKGKDVPSWREYLNAIPPEDAADLTDPESLLRTGAWLEECLLAANNLPLPRFVEKVLNGSGLLAELSRRPDRSRQLAVVGSFLDFIRAELIRRPRLDLTDFLVTLDNMDDNRISLPLRYQLLSEQSVTLVTAHSAKGLEFECVWMLDCNDKQWNGKKNTGGLSTFKLPPTLTLQAEASLLEARRRLFFVGMTRARRELKISYAALDEKRKPQTPALFVSELDAQTSLEVTDASVGLEDLTRLMPLRLGAVDPAIFKPAFEREAITDLLKDYRLSVSGFNRYLKCPLSFFYETVLRVPTTEREQAVFGEALHEALQDYYLRMLADPGRVFPGVSELLFYFEQAMERRRSRFSSKQYGDRLTQGKRELAAYYEKYRQDWTTQARVEQRIRDAEVKGVPLGGVIDRIDLLDDSRVAIWDYKSGSHAKDRLRPPTKAKPHGGSYWRQLVFYKLLYENRPGLPRRVARSGISFLVMNAKGEQPLHEIEISKEDLDTVTEMITTVWENIQQQNFRGCGETDCEWCRFEQENLREVPETDEEIEELDDF